MDDIISAVRLGAWTAFVISIAVVWNGWMVYSLDRRLKAVETRTEGNDSMTKQDAPRPDNGPSTTGNPSGGDRGNNPPSK